MVWIRVNNLKLNSYKMEGLLVGSNLVLGNGFKLTLVRVAFIPSESVSSLGILLDLGLLLDVQVVAVDRGAYHLS